MAKAAKRIAIPAVIEPIKYVKRKIQYHELHIDFEDAFNPVENQDKFLGFFSIIAKMAAAKNPLRYQPVQEAKIFMQDVRFIDADKKITGKLLYVKEDVFPELIDMLTDKTTDIDAPEANGIVETTHFIIDYSKEIKKIAIEYNHAGAKIADVITYCQLIGILLNATKLVYYKIIAKDELENLEKRMGHCTSMVIKVHRDNTKHIEGIDKKTYTALKLIQEQYSPKYISLKMGFSSKVVKKVQPITKTIHNIISHFKEDKNNLLFFDTVKINALDRDNNLKMKVFDLLVDKIETEVMMQRKPKHKVLVSADVFDKIYQSMLNENI